MIASTSDRSNPIAFSTAISVPRSRADMDMVIAASRTTMNNAQVQMDANSSLMFPIIAMNEAWNCFSVTVSVGYSLFLNIASICWLIAAIFEGSLILIQNVFTWPKLFIISWW